MFSKNLLKLLAVSVLFSLTVFPNPSWAVKKNGLDEFANESFFESLDSWHNFEREQKIERYEIKQVLPNKTKTKITLNEGDESLVIPSLIEEKNSIASAKASPQKKTKLPRLAKEKIP